MDDIVDRPIRIIGWEMFNDSNFRGEPTEFIRIRYYLEDDDANIKETVTQSTEIKERLQAIPMNVLNEVGGVLVMIQSKRLSNGGKKYSFAGL